MLHFFKVDDLNTQGSRIASHLVDRLRGVRDSTTAKINAFMRRELDYQAGVVEYFDTPDLRSGAYNIWLMKKNVSAVAIGLSYGRAWSDYPIDDTRVFLDADKGKITFYGPFRRWQRALRVTYNGGYPALGTEGEDAEVMACPEALRFAALQQAAFDTRRALGQDQGTEVDDDKKTPVRLVFGLLPDTAAAFMPYRRLLGT